MKWVRWKPHPNLCWCSRPKHKTMEEYDNNGKYWGQHMSSRWNRLFSSDVKHVKMFWKVASKFICDNRWNVQNKTWCVIPMFILNACKLQIYMKSTLNVYSDHDCSEKSVYYQLHGQMHLKTPLLVTCMHEVHRTSPLNLPMHWGGSADHCPNKHVTSEAPIRIYPSLHTNCTMASSLKSLPIRRPLDGTPGSKQWGAESGWTLYLSISQYDYTCILVCLILTSEIVLYFCQVPMGSPFPYT